GLDEMMRDARRGRFDVLLVWAFDRLAGLFILGVGTGVLLGLTLPAPFRRRRERDQPAASCNARPPRSVVTLTPCATMSAGCSHAKPPDLNRCSKNLPANPLHK